MGRRHKFDSKTGAATPSSGSRFDEETGAATPRSSTAWSWFVFLVILALMLAMLANC